MNMTEQYHEISENISFVFFLTVDKCALATRL